MKLRLSILMFIFFATMISSLSPYNIYILFSFSITCWLLIPTNKFWDSTAILILLFSIIYAATELLTNYSKSGFVLLSHIFAPTAFYRFARLLISSYKDEKYCLKFLALSIALYLFPLFILNFKDIALVGIVNPTRMMLSDLGEDGMLSATLYGLMASTGIGCISGVFIKSISRRIRIGLSILSFLSMLVVIHLVNRTGVVIFLVCVIFNLIQTKGKINIWIFTFFILFMVIVFATENLINQDIIDAYILRETDSDYDTSQLGGRLVIWGEAITNVFRNPLGGGSKEYAHNLWLDIARVGGWLPFILSIIVSIRIFKNTRLVQMNSNNGYSMLVVTILLAMSINAFVEPVIDASTSFFSLLFFVSGIITGQKIKLKNLSLNENPT